MYIFYEDPARGWLRISRKEIEELGIAEDISRYSYSNSKWVYLEEDCDMTVFCRAKGIGKAEFSDWWDENVAKRYSLKRMSRIRNMDSYTA